MSSSGLKRLLCLSVSVAALTGLAHPAAAQSSNTIEELVITAEKREQSLQDVPVAVSAFSAAKRDLIGINTIQDITNFTPGLQYNSSTDRVSLRGVGRLGQQGFFLARHEDVAIVPSRETAAADRAASRAVP
jgi:outer membrane receptor protein involved in Fe transport